MLLGSHCVLYATAIATDLEETLEKITLSGSEAVEIGARFFGTDRASELKEALNKYGVVLAGLHTILKISDLLDNPEGVYNAYKAPAEFAAAVGCDSLISSGMVDMGAADWGDSRLQDPAQQKAAAKALNTVVNRIYDTYGVTIRYHNHLWEFENNAAFYQALLEEAPDLQFGMDTGWVAAAGYDPVSFIEKYPSRFCYFHLRDVDRAAADAAVTFQQKAQKAFANVGEGDTDLPRLMKAISNTGYPVKAIVEYEFGEKDYHRYVKAVAYFRGILAAQREA